MQFTSSHFPSFSSVKWNNTTNDFQVLFLKLNELLYVGCLDQPCIHNKYYNFADSNYHRVSFRFIKKSFISSSILVQKDMIKL